ncbi:MAG: peptidylprolyl isomerase, partial [Bacteroidales bacterium]|nr:peptidylprolyl isomerase [Bacteroidales bacterium]
MRIKSIICCLIALLPICKTFSQTIVVDKKVAVVGKSLIKYSDIEEQYIQYLLQGYRGGDEIKCEIFEDLLVQKLMVTQAQVDSLEVTPGEV